MLQLSSSSDIIYSWNIIDSLFKFLINFSWNEAVCAKVCCVVVVKRIFSSESIVILKKTSENIEEHSDVFNKANGVNFYKGPNFSVSISFKHLEEWNLEVLSSSKHIHGSIYQFKFYTNWQSNHLRLYFCLWNIFHLLNLIWMEV